MADFTGFTPSADGAERLPVEVPSPVPEPATPAGASTDAVSGGPAPSPFVPAPTVAEPTRPAATTGGGAPMAPEARKGKFEDLVDVPVTFGALKAKVDLDAALGKVLEKIGVEDGTELADVTCIAEGEWKEVLDELVHEGTFTGALQRARAVRMVRCFLAKLGVVPPSLGAPVPAATLPAVLPAALLPGSVPVMPPPIAMWGTLPTPVDELQMISLRDHIDQGLKGTCARLASDALLTARALYEHKVDHEPRDACTPTPEQLSCLHAVLRSGRPPYCDFGVWNVYGPRLARFQDYDAQVVIGGQVVTKRVAAPSTLEGWMACWELFEVAMIGLNAASVGALKAYSDGLKELATLFPSKWPILVTTDLIVRSERWASIKERCDRSPPPGYDLARPWAHVIPASAWGSQDARVQAWWQRMVILPSATTPSLAQTATLVNALEGGALPAGAVAFPMPSDRNRRRSRSPPRQRFAEAPGSGEVCRDFTLSTGRCAGKGACPSQRNHACPVCGEGHRGIHHHKAELVYSALGIEKGKGKGKKGKKGKKGDAKGDAKKKDE